MVGCTDFSEDIQNLDNKVDNLGNTTQTELATLQKAITDLEAKLAAQYATKDEVAALKATLENSIASEVAALSEDIAAVSDALKTAKGEINDAIADLDDKKADKTAVDAAVKTATDAIAALKADLEAAKGDLEAEIESVKAEIADAQEQLNSKIDGVDAKAEELHNTILALSDYLKTLEAKVNELKGTLDALSEYLPTIEAKVAELKGTLDALSDHLEGREAEVDAKLNELHATLLALSDHLEEYEATTDFKLVELQGSLAALSVYLEEYEASVDAKFKEILNTFDSLDGFLDEKFAALEATDTDLYKEIEGIRVVLTALNNLLTDEAAARMAEDNALYELIGTSVTALNNLIADLAAEDEAIYAEIDGVRQAFTTLNNLLADEVADRTAEDAAIYELIGTSVTALNNLIADLAAEDDAIYVEMENIRTYIAQVYNSLSYDIKAVDAALQAHIAAFEAYKAQMKETVENLYKNDDAISERLAMHTDKLAKIIDAKVAELQAADEEIWTKINSLEESLSQAINYLLAEMEDKDAALYTKISEEVEAIYRELQTNITQVNNLVTDLQEEVSELANRVLENENAIAALEAAVEMLTDWALAHQDEYDDLVQLVTKHVADLTALIEDLQVEDGAIYEYIGETATNLNNLIADANARMDEIEGVIEQNYNTTGAAIGALSNLINDIQADLNDRVSANEEAIKKLFERVQSLVYVPDYSDHKATIDWAMIATTNVMPAAAENDAPAYSIVAKATDLKYLVKANAGEDAATAAAEIAANPSVLDYIVTDVKTRGASQSGADLQIVNVKAEGEYIIVSVVAKKFDAKFFENKRQGIYSAALALVDAKGNNLTSEYTNLVPGEAAHIEMGLYLTEADDVMNVAGTEETTKMPCNDSETVYTSFTPAIGFIIDDEKAMANLTSVQPYLTVEDLKALGYDMNVKYRLNLANALDLDIPGYSMSNNLINEYFITGNDAAGNVTVSVKENTPFTAKGKSIFAKYTATANGTTVTYVHYFVLSNAQVAVNMETNVDWTVALYSQLYDSKAYAKSYVVDSVAFEAVGGPVVNLKPVLNSPAVPAEGSPKFYVKNAGEWVEATDRSFKLAKFHNGSADIELIGGTYSWNNSYKIVWETVNDNENVDYTTTAIVNLVGRPDEIVVPVDAVYTLNGKESYFRADVDLFGESFKKVQPYLGYETAAADTAKWKAIFSVNFLPQLESKLPVVNGKPGRTSTLYNLEQARLSILEHNNGRYTINVDQPNVIEWTGTPYFGVPVKFTITGDVTVPATAENFIYSQDYVKDINGRPYAEVFGQIEEVEGDKEVGASKKYSIIKSDLAKYFNLDIESLEGHNYTVDFEVTLPDAESEIGNVKVLPNTTTPVVTDKGAATYYYFLQDQAVLDWDTYRGLEVIVSATLKVNGFPVDSKKLALITKDPLTLTGADFSVTRKLRENTVIPVYQKLVLTSSVETSFKNLLSEDKTKGTGVYDTLAEAEAYANGVYGADIEVVLGPKGVYYYDNTGKLIILGTNKYGYDEQTGNLTIYGDDANVKNYYADFTAVMSSVICGGEHNVPFRVTATVAK